MIIARAILIAALVAAVRDGRAAVAPFTFGSTSRPSAA